MKHNFTWFYKRFVNFIIKILMCKNKRKFVQNEQILIIAPFIIAMFLMIDIYLTEILYVLITWQSSDYEKLNIILYNFIFKQPLNFLIFLSFIPFIRKMTSDCPNKKIYNQKLYNPTDYAKLQSEKAEYLLLGAVFSFAGLIDSTDSEYKIFAMFICGYVLLLLSIYYRHLVYAIQMQEIKKKLSEISYECMQK